METEFDTALDRYAELVVKVGLNLQQGQRLMIADPLFNYGVSLHAAPLVRRIASHAYQAGAPFVGVMWGDDRLHRVRHQYAPRDSFAEFPSWQTTGLRESMERGDALLMVDASDPDLLQDQDPEAVSLVQKTSWQHFHRLMERFAEMTTSVCFISAAAPGWAAKVFPDIPPQAQEAKLWQAIFDACRVHADDPVSAWRVHLSVLAARSAMLNEKQYAALKFTAPGTNQTVGLPEGHRWQSASLTTKIGIRFVTNLPSEEVFTLPHRAQVEGEVCAAKPLCYGGTVIGNMRLKFSAGRVVEASADQGEGVLRQLIATDDGAARLGEIALVPHSSPISRSGLLFHKTLLDENAASHAALGYAYPMSLPAGASLSDEDFQAVGGNRSLIHVDFMIGSAEMNVDGRLGNGATEAVMRQGEWAGEYSSRNIPGGSS